MSEEYATFEEWLASRPPSVQALVAEFPLGTALEHEGGMLYLLGYTEGDMLIFSPINPSDNYDAANANKVYICANHLRPERN